MENESRVIEGYTIINSIHIGDRELLLGENLDEPQGLYYMTCKVKDIMGFDVYEEMLVSDSFMEIAAIYSDRLKEQVERTDAALQSENISREIIRADKCDCNIFDKNMKGKILVLNPYELRPEYQTATHQIIRCTGGNGANPNGIGTGVYGENMFTGKENKYRRGNILGELKPEYYPKWLKNNLHLFDLIKSTPNTFEYGGYHFAPIGTVNGSFKTISKNISTDKTLKMWSKSYDEFFGEGVIDYSPRDFYEAYGKKDCDVFKCLENGKNYMPGGKELFLWTGKFKDYTDKTQGKSNKDKEVER